MMRLLLIATCSLLCIGCTCSNNSIGEQTTENNLSICVYFKFDKPIQDYTIEGTFYPFSNNSETGQVEATFKSRKTGQSFVFSNVGQKEEGTDVPAKFSGFNIDRIVFSDEFKGWDIIDTVTFIYNTTKEPNDNSPILYAAEFQFYDIDNDGTDELLVNQWDRHRGGNYYDIYDITESGLKMKTVLGKESIDNMTLLNTAIHYED